MSLTPKNTQKISSQSFFDTLYFYAQVRVQWATPTSALVELTLAEGHVNNKGTMHGGFTAAMTGEIIKF